MSFIMAGIALGGLALKAYSNKQAGDAREDALVGGANAQQLYQGRINDLISQLLTQQGLSSPADEKAAIEGQFRQVLADNHANATQGLSLPGPASDAYQQAASRASGNIGDYGAQAANLMSTADAFRRQRINEGDAMQRYLDQVNRIRAAARDRGLTDEMRLRTIKPNPYLSAIGDFAWGYGANKYMNGEGFGAEE